VPRNAWSVSVAGTPDEAVEEILVRMREIGLVTAAAEKS
jgi:hypothetical protein